MKHINACPIHTLIIGGEKRNRNGHPPDKALHIPNFLIASHTPPRRKDYACPL